MAYRHRLYPRRVPRFTDWIATKVESFESHRAAEFYECERGTDRVFSVPLDSPEHP
jgi:hypothetical protein